MKKQLLIITGVLTGLLILSFLSFDVSLFLHFTGNIFWLGASTFKYQAFLLYTIVLILIIIFAKPLKFSDKSRSLLDLLIPSLIFVLLVAGVFIYLYICRKYNLLPTSGYATVYQGTQDSVTSLSHLHTLKPILTMLLMPFGVDKVDYYGSGLTIYHLLPEFRTFYIFMLVLFTGLAVSLVLKLLTIKKQYKVKPYYILLYSIFSFGILKSIYDGGLFYTEIPVHLSLYFFITSRVYFAKSNQYKKLLYLLLIFVITTLIFAQTRLPRNTYNNWDLLLQLPPVYIGCFLCSLGIIVFDLVNIQIKKYVQIALATVLCVAGMFVEVKANSIFMNYFKHITQNVSAGDRIIISSLKASSCTQMTSEYGFNLYYITAESNGTLHNYYRKEAIGLIENIEDEQNCTEENSPTRDQEIYITDPTKSYKEKLFYIDSTVDDIFSDFRVVQLSENKYSIRYKLRYCTPDNRRAFIKKLAHYGIDTYIMQQRQ